MLVDIKAQSTSSANLRIFRSPAFLVIMEFLDDVYHQHGLDIHFIL